MEPGTIMLDKERHMRLNIRGMKAYKKLTGGEITDLQGSIKEAETLIPVCWALLVWEDPSLTIEAATEMLEIVPLQILMKAVNECVAADSPLPQSPATS
jgi:hypothetical protein